MIKKLTVTFMVLLILITTVSCSDISSETIKETTEESTDIKTYTYKTINEIPLTFDLYLTDSAKDKDAPLLIFVHGGSWIQGTKEAVLYGERKILVAELLDEGYAIASFDYSLLNQDVSFPQNVDDVIDGINYIFDNHEALEVDPNNIGLWGSSAGGHLALLAAQKPSIANRLNYVIDYYGPTDLLSLLLETGNPHGNVSRIFFGEELALDQDKLIKTAYELSPINQSWTNDLPLLIVHGDADDVVPLIQSESLYDTFSKAGADKIEIIVIENGGHSLLSSKTVGDSVKRDIIDLTKMFIYKHYKN